MAGKNKVFPLLTPNLSSVTNFVPGPNEFEQALYISHALNSSLHLKLFNVVFFVVYLVNSNVVGGIKEVYDIFLVIRIIRSIS